MFGRFLIMAFVSGCVAVSGGRTRAVNSRRGDVSMLAVSRRDFMVSVAGAMGTLLVASPVYAKERKGFDLKELKEDVEELKYEDEAQINLDPAQEERSRFAVKAKDKVGDYREEEKKEYQEEEKKFEDAVNKEIEEGKALKEKFSKKKN